MKFKLKNPLRILVLMHEDLIPPESTEGLAPKDMQAWKMEYDVLTTLRRMGHDAIPVGLSSDLAVIRYAIAQHKPHIAFNLLEEFHGDALFDQHVVSYLELVKLRYTGCNPRGLTLAHDKALSKSILSYHRIQAPAFAVFPFHRRTRRPRRLQFPLFVKSLIEEGSVGISRASIVHDDEKLAERVAFVHRTTEAAAIVEEYIEGRELYVGVLGNQQLQTLAPWELTFERLPQGAPNIATGKVKWDYAYQEKVGVTTHAADLTPELRRKIEHVCKRIYRALCLSGYARLDFRLAPDGRAYLLEANPNPNLCFGEDFAEAANHGGVCYEELLQKIITLGLSYRRV